MVYNNKKSDREMKRREFMVLGSLVGISPYLKASPLASSHKAFAEVKETIASVQAHMFPENTPLPSAQQMRTIVFLEETLFHPTYDKDIRAFVIEGAKQLMVREKGKFTTYDSTQKEKALRSYEASRYGRNWLSRIMVLSMEAIFSDPIYGSNIEEKGWQAVHSFGGLPRPKTRYIGR